MLDTAVMSGDDVCCSVVFGTLVGMFSVMCSELLMTSAISCPTGQVGLGVGSWPSNRATEGSNPKGTRLYFVILLKNVEKNI